MCHHPSTQIFHIQKHEKRSFFVFVIICHVFVISLCLSINFVIYPLLRLFLLLVVFQHLSKIPFLLLSPSDLFDKLIVMMRENTQGQVHICQCICYRNFKINRLVTVCCSIRIDHDVYLNFVLQNTVRRFLCVCSQQP